MTLPWNGKIIFAPAILLSMTAPDAESRTQPSTEADRNALEMAQRACSAQDFRALLSAMSVSAAVRERYSAPSIEVSLLDRHGATLATRMVTAATYDAFPVRQIDYYYKPAKPSVSGDEDSYLDLQFNQSQSNVYSVEWAEVHFDGKSDGGDDLGGMIDADGNPVPPGDHPDAQGQLLFQPTSDCWQLVADIRWAQDRSPKG